jgi:hypothetical protein
MAKKIENKATETPTLTINDGVRFGFGLFLIILTGFAMIGSIAWLILYVARYFGLAF